MSNANKLREAIDNNIMQAMADALDGDSSYEAAHAYGANILQAFEDALPKHIKYGSNYMYSIKLTQKYIKEKGGEVTGYNKALLEVKSLLASARSGRGKVVSKNVIAIVTGQISERVYEVETPPRDEALPEGTELSVANDFNPFDFVEPCEPDCTKERHAYHQGQWDMAVRMEAQQQTKKEDV